MEPAPDYGNTMWAAGARACEHALANVSWAVLHNYNAYRQVTGFIDSDSGKTLVVTLRTKQARSEIIKLMLSGAPLVATGKLAPKQDAGDSGERYRPLIGELKPL